MSPLMIKYFYITVWNSTNMSKSFNNQS